MKKFALLLVVILIFAFIIGCTQRKPEASEGTAVETAASDSGETVKDTEAGDCSDPKCQGCEPEKVKTRDSFKLTFVIKTDRGDIKGELYPDVAPNTVLNFVTLAKNGFYDGLNFHRVVPGFVIQGGCPQGSGTGGPGYCIPAEFNSSPHKLGALAMARAQHPDSAGSQFYIVLNEANCRQLDGEYTVFGQVTEGMQSVLGVEVGDKISKIEIIGELPQNLKDKQLKKSNVSK
jgi:peptidyl-prolyl cis-trans isomerase B (cyclophilin B)